MNNLEEYYLKDCVEKIIDYRGKTPQKLGSDWSESGVRVISALNVHNGFIDNEEQIRFVTEEVYKKWMQEDIKKYDCFIASEGASLGENCIWDSDEKVVLGQRLFAIRTNPNILDPWYFAMYMQSEIFRKQIDQISTGSTVFGISQSVLLGIKLELPDIDKQRKIGLFYRSIRNKIKNNKSIISTLNNMNRDIFDYWFFQYEFPYNKTSYKSSGGSLKWDELLKRNIPSEWSSINIMELISWEGTSQPPKSSFIYDDTEGYIRFIQNRDYESTLYKTYIPVKKALGKCKKNDILIDKYGDAGKTRFGIEGAYNVALSKINVKKEIYREYIRGFLSSKGVYNYLHDSSMASTRASLNESNISYLNLVLPSEDLLKKYNNIAIPVINKIIILREENEKLVEFEKFIIPVLMSGQIIIEE